MGVAGPGRVRDELVNNGGVCDGGACDGAFATTREGAGSILTIAAIVTLDPCQSTQAFVLREVAGPQGQRGAASGRRVE